MRLPFISWEPAPDNYLKFVTLLLWEFLPGTSCGTVRRGLIGEKKKSLRDESPTNCKLNRICCQTFFLAHWLLRNRDYYDYLQLVKIEWISLLIFILLSFFEQKESHEFSRALSRLYSFWRPSPLIGKAFSFWWIAVQVGITLPLPTEILIVSFHLSWIPSLCLRQKKVYVLASEKQEERCSVNE